MDILKHRLLSFTPNLGFGNVIRGAASLRIGKEYADRLLADPSRHGIQKLHLPTKL